MTSRAAACVACAVALAAAAGRARADDVATYETDGSAAATLSDARVRALDVAFAAAVQDALTDLVAPADLAAFRGDLEREVIGRARLYVASFKVPAEGARGANYHVSVQVRIDRDRVRAKLGELGVPMKPTGAGPATSPAPPASVARATVLLRVTAAGQVAATYGAAAAQRVPGVDQVLAQVTAAGLAPVPAPRSGPAARAGGDLPLDDASARALAGDVDAPIAIVVGVDVEGAGAVRGVRAEAAVAVAHVRILDGGRVVGQATARAGGYAAEDPAAIDRAVGAAAAEATAAALPGAVAAQGPATPAAPPPPLGSEPGAVLVEIKGVTAWASVHAIEAQLAATSGVSRVEMRRVSAGEVVLAAITKQRAARIAAAVRATPQFTGRASTDGELVEVTP